LLGLPYIALNKRESLTNDTKSDFIINTIANKNNVNFILLSIFLLVPGKNKYIMNSATEKLNKKLSLVSQYFIFYFQYHYHGLQNDNIIQLLIVL